MNSFQMTICTHKELSNVFSNTENASQNHSEIPSHRSQNDYQQNNKLWQVCGGKRNPYTLLVGM
jgi:hypothetical protein